MLLRLQLIKALEEARGNGTSMISLIMPPKDQVSAAAAGVAAQTKDQLAAPLLAEGQ